MADVTGITVVTRSDFDGVERVELAWTSDAGGDVEYSGLHLVGRLNRVVTVAGASAPTDLYDVTLEDIEGADVLLGVGADRPQAGPTNALVADGTVFVEPLVLGNHTFKVANAGNAKTGTAVFYLALS